MLLDCLGHSFLEQEKWWWLSALTLPISRCFYNFWGTYLWLECAVPLVGYYIASMENERTSKLTLLDLAYALEAAKIIRYMTLRVNFRNPIWSDIRTKTFENVTYANTAFIATVPSGHDWPYIVSKIKYPDQDKSHGIYYPVDWASMKRGLACYSAFGVRIWFWAVVDDRNYSAKMSLQFTFSISNCFRAVFVGSKYFFSTLIFFDVSKSYRLKHTVRLIKNKFESGTSDKLK